MSYFLPALNLALSSLFSNFLWPLWCFKASKSPGFLWFWRLFQLLGSLGRDWWKKNGSFLLGFVFSKNEKNGKKFDILRWFLLWFLCLWSPSCAAVVNVCIYSVVSRLRDGEWG
jgi:hypothetical protein